MMRTGALISLAIVAVWVIAADRVGRVYESFAAANADKKAHAATTTADESD